MGGMVLACPEKGPYRPGGLPPHTEQGRFSLACTPMPSLPPPPPAAQPLPSRPAQCLATGSQAPTGQGAAQGDGGPGPRGTPRSRHPGRAGQAATCAAVYQLCHREQPSGPQPLPLPVLSGEMLVLGPRPCLAPDVLCDLRRALDPPQASVSPSSL